MKRLFRTFILTKSEQRVVVLIVLVLIAGALLGYQRRAHPFPIQVTTTTEPKASPSSTEAENER